MIIYYALCHWMYYYYLLFTHKIGSTILFAAGRIEGLLTTRTMFFGVDYTSRSHVHVNYFFTAIVYFHVKLKGKY